MLLDAGSVSAMHPRCRFLLSPYDLPFVLKTQLEKASSQAFSTAWRKFVPSSLSS
jgi:hypothetical protein